MSEGSEIEQRILKAIQAGRSRGETVKLVDLVAVLRDDLMPTLVTGHQVSRVIDKGLQRLRKAKRISYSAKEGWSLSDG